MNCDATNDEATAPEALTADDIKALRTADDLCFDQLTGEIGQIRAIRRARRNHGTVFSDLDDATRTIRVETGVTRWEGRPDPRTAFVLLSGSDEVWRTIASLLRVGDRLRLDWRMDGGSNGYVKHAMGDGLPDCGEPPRPMHFSGLHVDELRLVVERPATPHRKSTVGNGKVRRLHFTVETLVCAENAARMIRIPLR